MQRRARRGFPIADRNGGDRPSTQSEEKHWMSEQAIAIAPPAGADAAEARTLLLSALSWIGYEATRIPYLILIKIYIFAPYVVKVKIGDPVLGQTMFARYGFVTGLIGAMTVPFLGAALDRMGPRKPWIAVFILASLPLLVSLWWAKPDHSGLSVHSVIVIVMGLNLLFVYSEILHNAMLGLAVGMRRVGRTAGISLGVANLISVAILIFLLWGFALPGHLHSFGVPDMPLFGFSQASHEMERLIGPLVAALACAGLLMLLRFTIDAPPSGAIGMCFTGNFALTMMLEPSMLAPVLSQPSLPLNNPAGIEVAPDEVKAVRERLERDDLTVMAYRFEGDKFCMAQRFAAYSGALGDRFIGRVLPDSAANPDVPPFFAQHVT